MSSLPAATRTGCRDCEAGEQAVLDVVLAVNADANAAANVLKLGYFTTRQCIVACIKHEVVAFVVIALNCVYLSSTSSNESHLHLN